MDWWTGHELILELSSSSSDEKAGDDGRGMDESVRSRDSLVLCPGEGAWASSGILLLSLNLVVGWSSGLLFWCLIGHWLSVLVSCLGVD